MKIISRVEWILWLSDAKELDTVWLSSLDIFSSHLVLYLVQANVQGPWDRSLDVVALQIELLFVQ